MEKSFVSLLLCVCVLAFAGIAHISGNGLQFLGLRTLPHHASLAPTVQERKRILGTKKNSPKKKTRPTQLAD